MSDYVLKCPECGGKMYSYEQYYIYKKGKAIQVCKACRNTRQVHRMFVGRIKGKTIVID